MRGGDALALAAIAMLLVDPLAVLAPGFWLSFAGVAWLAVVPAATQGIAIVRRLPVARRAWRRWACCR